MVKNDNSLIIFSLQEMLLNKQESQSYTELQIGTDGKSNIRDIIKYIYKKAMHYFLEIIKHNVLNNVV